METVSVPFDHTLFRTIVTAYLQSLQLGGQRVQIKAGERIHISGLVHASNLMDCPLKAAKERSGADPVFPSLSVIANPTLMLRMQEGTMIAEIFQEALQWAAAQFKQVQMECNLTDPYLQLQGRCDALIQDHFSRYHVVEFKHRNKTWKDKFPQPRLGDLFQLMAYLQMPGLNMAEGWLVVVNTPDYREFTEADKGFEVWHLEPQHTGGYILVSEHGYPWEHPLNTGEYLNSDTLKAEIQHQMAYLQGLEDPPFGLDQDDKAWQCRRILKKPTANAAGRMMALCPYWCHGEAPNILSGAGYRTGEHGVEFEYEF